jgi:hypothetical protein
MLEHGHILQTEVQGYINKADAVTFITATKPAMKPKSYEQFTNWVGRRRRLGKTDQDDLQDMAKWKVSIPDFMDPTNPAYYDTSISAKQYNEREEQRKARQCKMTVKLPAGLSTTEEEQTHEFIFRPKDRMTTVAKNIRKKFNLGVQIELINEGSEKAINLFSTADVAGLKDGSIVTIHRARTESSTESTESVASEVTIRIQRLTSAKIWSKSFPYTTSTTHLYHEFQNQCQYNHGSFTLLRSDGSRVSRYTTLGNLHLRRNEVLIYQPIDSIMIDAFWLDNNRQPQNKCVYVEANMSIGKLKDILREELILDFNPMITVPGEFTDDGAQIDELTDSGKLVAHIRRIGQGEWDNTTFENSPAPRQIMSIVAGTDTTRTYTVEVGPNTIVADVAKMIYEDFPEHKRKMIEDVIGLPYELTEMAEHIVPASGLINVRVSPTLEYTQDKLDAAVTFAAAMQSTTVEALLHGSYSSFRP